MLLLKTNRASRLLTVIALLGIFFSSTVPPASFVLCIGDDGHRSIEAAFHGTCLESATPYVYSFAAPLKDKDGGKDSHCGPCVDLSLLENGEDTRLCNSRTGRQPLDPAPFLATRHPRTSFSRLQADSNRANSADYPVLAFHASLRTSILLI